MKKSTINRKRQWNKQSLPVKIRINTKKGIYWENKQHFRGKTHLLDYLKDNHIFVPTVCLCVH